LAKERGISREEAVKLVPSDWGYTDLAKIERLKAERANILSRAEDGDWTKDEVRVALADTDSELASALGTVPDNPYKTNWHELAFKRALTEAVNDPSIERLTWTTGEVQKDRYNLAKYINSIEARQVFSVINSNTGNSVGGGFNQSKLNEMRLKNPEADYQKGEIQYDLAIAHKDGHVEHETLLSEDDLEEYVGKEMAERIIDEATGDVKTYSGLDLEMGGEFHKQLYDKKITQFAKKFLKKYGVEPQRIKPGGAWEVFDPKTGKATNYFSTEAEAERFVDDWNERIPGSIRDYDQSKGDFWSIDITPEMREEIMTQGVPLTQRRKPIGLMAGYA
jgi:hypothetical protein